MKIYNCCFEVEEWRKGTRVPKKISIKSNCVVAKTKRRAYFKALEDKFPKSVEQGEEENDTQLGLFSADSRKYYTLHDDYTLETAVTEVAEDVYMRIWGEPELPLVIYGAI